MQRAIETIIARHPTTSLKPVCFFVARSGVLTLAYEGFCSSLLNIKGELEKEIPQLESEHPGSRWPKTSLGALRAGATLSREEIEELHTLCLGWDTTIRQSESLLDIDELHLVTYECRSLERLRSNYVCRLDSTSNNESHDLPAWHLKDVDTVLAQFNVDNLEAYSAQIQQAGNHEDHYRDDAPGTTLVYLIKPGQLPFVSSFMDDVERLLPARYAWFAADSLHVTVRHLAEVAIPKKLHTESQ